MHMNKIVCMGHTLGSEPSKYQQEKKSKEIPVVAASEPGGAQTICGDIYGVVGRTDKAEESRRLAE